MSLSAPLRVALSAKRFRTALASALQEQHPVGATLDTPPSAAASGLHVADSLMGPPVAARQATQFAAITATLEAGSAVLQARFHADSKRVGSVGAAPTGAT